MFQKWTQKFLVAAFVVTLLSLNALTFASGKMKDIELDPGKGDNIGNQVKVFPTVAHTTVTVDFFFETDDHVTLSVYDLQGRAVDPGTDGFVPKARLHESLIDVNTLANGVYFVKLAQDHGATMTTKFIVRH